MAKRCVVILAQGFEEIEAITTIDILRRAGIEVTIAGLNKLEITGSHQITVMADIRLDQAGDDFDCCVLPGGMPGSSNLAGCEKVNALVKTMFTRGKIVAAICAAPAVILAPAGILKGKSVTCFPERKDSLDKSITFLDRAVVVDGNLITSQGPGTAFLFALKIVEKLCGEEASEKVRKATIFP